MHPRALGCDFQCRGHLIYQELHENGEFLGCMSLYDLCSSFVIIIENCLGCIGAWQEYMGRRCSLKLGASGFDDGHLNQTRKLIWDALGALGIISQFHVTSQHCLVGPSVQIQLLRCFANLRHICQRATEVVFRIWKVCQEHSNATGTTCQMCIKWKKEEKRHQ